jgi:hypothetical protein
MQTIPDWGWIIISVLSIVFFVVIIILILKGRGMEISLNGKTFKLESGVPGSKPGVGCNESQLIRLQALERKLSTIYDSLKLTILIYMAHDLEVPEDALSDNDDLTYIRMLLWAITYGKNGKHSIRTIVEDYILRGKFEVPDGTHETDKIKMRQSVMREIVPQITSEMMMMFDDKYDNQTTHFDKESKTSFQQNRAVSQEQVTKIMREHINTDISPIIETIFDEVTE